MSDTADISAEEVAAREARIQAGRDRMAKARQAKMERARMGAQARTATQRTAADAANVGVAVAGEPGNALPSREPEPEVLTRVSRRQRSTGTFDLPARFKKPGWDYKWETISVYNMPAETSAITDTYEAAWRPELARNWPTLVLPDTGATAPVIRGGQQLFGRPMSFTIQAKEEDYAAAKEQEAVRLQASRGGSDIRDGASLGDIPGVRVAETVTALDVQGEFGTYGRSPIPGKPAG